MLDMTDLLHARDDLFSKPEAYFDPFASPMLFFRTPGTEVPVLKAELDDMAYLSMIEREDFYKQQMMLSSLTSSSSSDLTPAENSARDKVKKKASRLFPSANLNLDLPSLYISTGASSPLHDQATELSHVMRKSIFRQHKARLTRAAGFERKVLRDDELDQMDEEQARVLEAAEAMAEQKVCFQASEGSGMWDLTAGGRNRIGCTITWLKEKLAV